MGLNGAKDTAFSNGPGSQSQVRMREDVYFGRSQSLVNLQPFTITNVNCTPTPDNIGGRPCVNLHGAGATTDGSNFCYGTASILMQPGKENRFRFSWYSADAVNHDMAYGVGVVGTTLIAADPTDFVEIRKLSGSGVPFLRFSKASSTPVAIPLPIGTVESTGALQSGAWYDFELVVSVDPTTSGAGSIQVFMAKNGSALTKIYDAKAGAGIPDTVKVAPFCAGRAGAAVSTVWYWGEYDYQIGA